MYILILVLGVISGVMILGLAFWLLFRHASRKSNIRKHEGLLGDLRPLIEIEKKLMIETDFFKVPYQKRVAINNRHFTFSVIPQKGRGLRLEIIREMDGEKITIPNYIPRDMDIMIYPNEDRASAQTLLPVLLQYKEKGYFRGDPIVAENQWENEWAED